MIAEEPGLSKKCKSYSAYAKKKTDKIIDVLYGPFMKEAYDVGMVIHNYSEIIEATGLQSIVNAPSMDNLKDLNREQILACIAWHFRADHFNNGSLINTSIADGYMLNMLKAYTVAAMNVNRQ